MCLRIQVFILSIWRQTYLYLEIMSAVSMQVAEVAGKQKTQNVTSVFALKITSVLASHYFCLFSITDSIQVNNFKAVAVDLLRVYLYPLLICTDVDPEAGLIIIVVEISGKLVK